jgi:hypothetical protein
MGLQALVRASNGQFFAVRLSSWAVFLAAWSVSIDLALANPPKGISRSKHPAILYGVKFNAGTSVPRPPVALRRAGEVPQSVKFNIKFTGDFPEDAKAPFRAAAAIWSALLTSRVPIEIEANWTSLGQFGPSGIVLGSTHVWLWNSDHAPTPLQSNIWYPTALASKYVGGDVDGTNPDMHVDLNSDVKNWYFGTDGLTPLGQFDFMSVVLNQLAHGLGFSGSMTVNAAGVGSFGVAGNGDPAIFDTMVQGDVGSLSDGISVTNPSLELGTQLQAHNVYLKGNATTKACGGGTALLYSPLPWKQGSSYVHLDEFAYPPGNVNSLMTPSIGWAEPIHNPGPIVLGVLMDIGW